MRLTMDIEPFIDFSLYESRVNFSEPKKVQKAQHCSYSKTRPIPFDDHLVRIIDVKLKRKRAI